MLWLRRSLLRRRPLVPSPSSTPTCDALQSRSRMAPTRFKLLLVLGTAAILGTLVILHTPGLNGPWYWQWRWQWIDSLRLYPAMLAATVPFFLGQWLHARDPGRTTAAIGLVMLSTLCLELTAAGMHRKPFDLGGVADAIRDPGATGYFTDAANLVRRGIPLRGWMSTYAERMPRFHNHARFKPPGLLLYHMAFIKLLGPARLTALVAGLSLAILATCSVAATYLLILKLCGQREAAFCGASFFALCPSLVLFLPQFDQVYPAIACAMIGLWAVALAAGSARYAVGFGAVMAFACFLSQMFLVLGIFLAALALRQVAQTGRPGLARVVRYAVMAILTVVSIYALLWLSTGYDPIATYRTASGLLVDFLPLIPERPYPVHVAFDLLDFALGSGWISFLLVAYFLLGRSEGSAPSRELALLAVCQVLVSAALGLVPGETARTWMLMYPLLMIPIGLELAGWDALARLAVYGALCFLLAALTQNMGFVVQ